MEQLPQEKKYRLLKKDVPIDQKMTQTAFEAKVLAMVHIWPLLRTFQSITVCFAQNLRVSILLFVSAHHRGPPENKHSMTFM